MFWLRNEKIILLVRMLLKFFFFKFQIGWVSSVQWTSMNVNVTNPVRIQDYVATTTMVIPVTVLAQASKVRLDIN